MRSFFIFCARTPCAACLLLVALSCPGQADNYGIARAEFNRLPIDQRYETQAPLGVAGYWPAVTITAIDFSTPSVGFRRPTDFLLPAF